MHDVSGGGDDCQNSTFELSLATYIDPPTPADSHTTVHLGTCEANLHEDIQDYYTLKASSCYAAVSHTGCNGSEICTPPVPGGFEDRICIYRQGSYSCEQSDYPVRFVRHISTTDNRDCASDCACNLNSNFCVGTVRFHSDTDCDGVAFDLEVTNDDGADNCISTVAGNYYSTDISDWHPDCQPSGGDKIGQASFTDPVTFCCNQ